MTPNNSVNEQTEIPSLLKSQRFIMALMMSMAIFIAYAQRNGLSSLIVSMSKDENGCGYYDWKSETGVILGSFYIGYAVLQFAGGYLVARTDAYRALMILMVISTIAILAGPVTANMGYKWFIATRVLAGVGQSVVWPSIYSIAAFWFPKNEKATLMGLIGGSPSLGTIIALFLGGMFCKMSSERPYYISGWAIFHYILGIAGFVWLIMWIKFASRSPVSSKKISPAEKVYIETNIENDSSTPTSIPLSAILKSKHVWGVGFTMMFFDFGLFATCTIVPSFLREALGFSYHEMGLYSALPHVMCLAGCIINGYLSDQIVNKNLMTRTNCRKFFQCGSGVLVGCSMCLIGFVPQTHRIVAVILFLFCGLFLSMTMSAGYVVSVSEISGKYSGVVYGLGNTMSSIAGFLAPTIAKAITGNAVDNVIERWRIVMLVNAASMFMAALIFAFLGSGVPCKWATSETKEEEDNIEL